MSAFVVDVTHIDAMVTAGLRFGAVPGASRLRWMVRELTPADKERGYAAGQPWGPEAWRLSAELSRELTAESAGRVGAMLLAENRRSVDFRYAEEELEPVYEFHALPGTPDPVVVLAAISCYRYQSCEHPEWESSEAARFCEALEALCIRRLPGYHDAPWEITDRAVFLPKRPAPSPEVEPWAANLPTDTKGQVAFIRSCLRRLVPGVSVRMARGTAYGWVDVGGSGDYGHTTAEQQAALEAIGLRGNISPDSRGYWVSKLAELTHDA